MDRGSEGEMKGRGSVYRQPGTANWTISYYANGKRIREATGTANRNMAVKLLNERLHAASQGRVVIDKGLTFEGLAKILTEEYRANERKSLRRIEQSLWHLREFFGDWKARNITADAVNSYVAYRRKQPHRQGPSTSNATINRELTALKRAMTLAVKAGKLEHRPEFGMLEENNARKGFFEPNEFKAVYRELPVYLKPVLHAAYLTGWRAQELLTRRWEHVDFASGWLRLDPGETKNNEGREFPLIPDLRALLERQRQDDSPWVFHYADGRRIGQYDGAWRSACRRAGLSGRLLHDCRRTAVRNLERAGVPRSTAMAISGHRTDEVYRRYAIVDHGMMREAGAKIAALHERDGHNLVIISDLGTEPIA
jgi:integrase